MYNSAQIIITLNLTFLVVYRLKSISRDPAATTHSNGTARLSKVHLVSFLNAVTSRDTQSEMESESQASKTKRSLAVPTPPCPSLERLAAEFWIKY